MAITSNTFNIQVMPVSAAQWYVSLASEDASGAEEIKAAVAGSTHYLTKLVVRADAAMDISVGSGESTGAVTTVHIGPVPLDATAGVFEWEAPPGCGLKITADTAIVIDASGAGTVWIEAHGKTAKHG